ncbi:transposase [Nocardia sp. NBC_00881]|uniref:transposase n=1 Tax=Nocardia sp. NBC_00881 TaxID=2975995 RepID=UPI0038651B84|nr:transposase [Nocardia sp. NBC_00881]
MKKIYNAEDADKARSRSGRSTETTARSSPKPSQIVDDTDVLLAFYDYPAEHWIHLRTTNPIESTFGHSNIANQAHQGPESRAAGFAMARSS